MQKYHDEPKQYKGYLKSALAATRLVPTDLIHHRLGMSLACVESGPEILLEGRRGTGALSVSTISDDGGKARRDRWAYASVHVQLTNATPEETELVRHLVQRIVGVMKGEEGLDSPSS